jgi:thymidine kinase
MTETKEGSIHLIIGPMFAGKSTELLRTCNRYEIAQKAVLYIKSSKDTRYDDYSIVTHDQKSKISLAREKLLDLKGLEIFDVIGIRWYI